jgi:hypothetical protein
VAGRVGTKIKLYNVVRYSLGYRLLDEGQNLSCVQEVLDQACQDMTRRYARRPSHKVAETLCGCTLDTHIRHSTMAFRRASLVSE